MFYVLPTFHGRSSLISQVTTPVFRRDKQATGIPLKYRPFLLLFFFFLFFFVAYFLVNFPKIKTQQADMGQWLWNLVLWLFEDQPPLRTQSNPKQPISLCLFSFLSGP